MSGDVAAVRPEVEEALQILGIRNLLLGIHDAAFPSLAAEDIGCGTPYSRGAARFLRFARELGFTGLQLGPQGITSPGNPSPYDGSFFSREPLLLAPLMLTRPPWELLDRATLDTLAAACPPDRSRVHRAFADQACRRITAEAGARYRSLSRDRTGASRTEAIRQAYAAFRKRHAVWLEKDALYEILRDDYGGRSWSTWEGRPEAGLDRHLFAPPPGGEAVAALRRETLRHRHAAALETFGFTQFLIAEQHQALRRRCRRLALTLFGDCQIGLSDRDAWAAQAFLLPGYRLGAPPSRTNPDGQPWNYPVLDPRQYFTEGHVASGQPGPVVRFLRRRIDKLFAEFDGLRIDHPHGLICPWVYRADQPEPLRAVQTGARLFAAPRLADHPDLARFAIARTDQLDEGVARYDDHWVTDLDPEQVERYASLFAVIVESARNRRHGPRQIACEILSTQPYPIRRVMEQYGQGRFRVTQKADLANDDDVYRSENARSEDWLMLGSHDTPPVWEVAEKWRAAGTARQQAEYLAKRLRIPPRERTAWVERTAADTGLLVQAKFADLFLGPAENIMVYFTDLLGLRQAYNRPGTVSEANWSLRVAPDYRAQYRTKLAHGRALDIPGALAAALRAKSREAPSAPEGLVEALEIPARR